MNGIEENIITASKKSRFFALPKIVLSLRTKTKLDSSLNLIMIDV